MTLLVPLDHAEVQAGTARAWAAQINAQWRQSLESILEAGRVLLEAKASLPHGQFTVMIENDLDFGARTARRLMAIAQDARLSNPATAPRLPKAWTTLYELTTLSDEEFDRALADDVIHPKMERADVDRVRPAPGESLPNGARAIMSSRVEDDDSLDYFPTPPWGTRALVEHVFPVLNLDASRYSAWEPACGEGHIAEVLHEYFAEVTASDIHDYGYGDHVANFLHTALKVDADWIITNPPFGDVGEAFVHKALERAGVGIAMFMRVQWLDTIGRYERIFRDKPPTLIAFFAERVNLCKGRWDPKGGTATAYMWLVWKHQSRPRAPFWIPPICRETLSRADDAERFTQRPVQRRVA